MLMVSLCLVTTGGVFLAGMEPPLRVVLVELLLRGLEAPVAVKAAVALLLRGGVDSEEAPLAVVALLLRGVEVPVVLVVVELPALWLINCFTPGIDSRMRSIANNQYLISGS